MLCRNIRKAVLLCITLPVLRLFPMKNTVTQRAHLPIPQNFNATSFTTLHSLTPFLTDCSLLQAVCHPLPMSGKTVSVQRRLLKLN